MGSIRIVFLAALLALAGPAGAQEAGRVDLAKAFAASLTAVPAGALPTSGSFYVPAYSQVVRSVGGATIAFSVTLTIHNVSQTCRNSSQVAGGCKSYCSKTALL